MFGAGVILSTAWIHMFGPAFEVFSHPCLPSLFTTDYKSWPAAIALFGALFVHFIQFLASRAIHKSQLAHSHDTTSHSNQSHDTVIENRIAINKKVISPQESIAIEEAEHTHHLLLSVKEKHVTTYILELGVASHSVIIGLTLGVSRDTGSFTSLLIALGFHHLFEGIALSAVVLESAFQKGGIIFMILLYSLSTPVGIAIGIALSATCTFYLL